MDTKNARKGSPPEDWPALFLEKYSNLGNITLAARAVYVSRSAVYERAAADPEFKAAMKEARAEAADVLEGEAWRRAVSGVEKPVYQGGQKVGTIREYSDTLLILLLKATKPARFRERKQIDIHTLTNEQIVALLEADALCGSDAEGLDDLDG